MNTVARIMSLAALAALAACNEDSTLSPQTDLSLNTSGRTEREISVMTRNMYIGADVDAAMLALATPDPSDDLPALMVALQTLQRTDFATRVAAMADEIDRIRPDVVGLQEVYDLTVIPAWLGLPGDPVQIDFLAALQAALAARGLGYEVAARNTTTDATVAGGAVHIVDHDALLVNPARVTLDGPAVEAVFQANLGPIAPGVTILRGYVARPATVGGVQTLLVNAHTESGADPQIAGLRYYQASELAAFIGAAPRVVLTGDFNDDASSLMYGALASASLTDTWAALRGDAPGYSCCQAPDLSNRRSTLSQRIDFIWTRGFAGPSGRVAGEIDLVSAHPSALVRGAFGLVWPSDHAGIVARLSVPRPFPAS